MKIRILTIGKSDRGYQMLSAEYEKRLSYYVSVEWVIVPSLKVTKSFTEKEIQSKESTLLLEKIKPSDFVVLLDRKGKEISSIAFAGFMQTKINQGISSMTFVIGGAYGFDNNLYRRADVQLSFSLFTFPHQLFRLIFLEQLYRAFTILKNEKYHHE